MKISILLFLISLNAFASFEGTIQLDKEINYKRFFWEKTALPGDYLIKISKNAKSLLLKFKDITGKKHSIKIKMPKHALPEHGGSIKLVPGQTGQEFGIDARYTSDQITREERTTRESCTIQVRVRRCRRDENGRERCRYTYENRPGFQYVRYMITTFEKNLQLALIDHNDISFGNSETRTIHSNTVVLYRGSCQRN